MSDSSSAQIESDFLIGPDSILIRIEEDVLVRDYFDFLDSLIKAINHEYELQLNEHDIVHANPWIIDTLSHTDYYYLKKLGIESKDPLSLVALPKNQILWIPDAIAIERIRKRIRNTYIDVNIPEFHLRIVENQKEKYRFLVRVGSNKKQYLEMVKKEVDLRTRPGIGEIIRINKAPTFINPRDNRQYKVTKRDDGIITKLPNIPWLEPIINGERLGQLIHPTTNLATLGKAYSNGCIGLREGDAWIVYYYAPMGTKVIFRYDLEGVDEQGKSYPLKDIYPGFEFRSNPRETVASLIRTIDEIPASICDCGM